MKKEKTKINEAHLVDYRMTEVGQQNWEVCTRMLAHDLVDMAEHNKEVKELLTFYSITVLPNGSHTMALPRKYLPQFQYKISGHTRKRLADKTTPKKKNGDRGGK